MVQKNTTFVNVKETLHNKTSLLLGREVLLCNEMKIR